MGKADALDRFQRRHRWAGLPVAVVYKYNDDQGNYLAALIAEVVPGVVEFEVAVPRLTPAVR